VAGEVLRDVAVGLAVVDQQRGAFVGDDRAGLETVQHVAASDAGLQELVQPVVR